MSRLAAGCVEESIGVCFRESTCALSDAVEAALKKILSEAKTDFYSESAFFIKKKKKKTNERTFSFSLQMRDSLCAVVVTLLKKSQYDAQIVRKVEETKRGIWRHHD